MNKIKVENFVEASSTEIKEKLEKFLNEPDVYKTVISLDCYSVSRTHHAILVYTERELLVKE